ncbi:diaminopimelate decarboxylase [Sediminivirga luteola]|uniref:Diaminopimelate decarboxylase n=1 Tax=Sediminivirga luteola TaxID=1774748 RepID=A0A8J2TWE1_9MICO|nr:diaminopimelate decarboxylase [Sediminivirga luteola]MCI2266534.1 diaminopimelate decarboxylase [Sediminivirga luteola]GGA07724.1 diaminopimelate decarboxylase [Sediminivirga luteola]
MAGHVAGPLHSAPSPVWLPYPEDVNALLPQLWSRNITRGTDGALRVAGHSVNDLARDYGTPTFVLDVDDFRSRAREFRTAFEKAFAAAGTQARSYYAGKAFLCTQVARWALQDGLGLDVCSLGELLVAQRAGVPGERMTMHGNNKSPQELSAALDHGVNQIVVDSLDEIGRLSALAAQKGVTAPVVIRVTVGVEAHTHDFIATAHEDQKFGFSLASGAAREAAERVHRDPHLNLLGLHSHIGSQIFDASAFEVAAARLMGLRAELRRDLGAGCEELILGGGFGISYTSQDTPQPVDELAAGMARAVVRACEDLGDPLPRTVSFEPGRSLIGPAMFTLYTVGTVKPVETGHGERLYVAVDGGMSDNPRTALYDADYSCTVAGRASGAEPRVTRVVGMHCESGDIIVRDEYAPADIAAGDLLAVPGTGAYCRPLASNYNHVPRPGVLAVTADAIGWIVRPETHEDLLSTDVAESWNERG